VSGREKREGRGREETGVFSSLSPNPAKPQERKRRRKGLREEGQRLSHSLTLRFRGRRERGGEGKEKKRALSREKAAFSSSGKRRGGDHKRRGGEEEEAPSPPITSSRDKRGRKRKKTPSSTLP